MAETRFALLIDAENIPAKYAQNILAEIEKHGTCLYKRVYGNINDITKNKWQDAVKEYSLTPRIQINNTRGKNASDSALIIDAMDILHTGNVTGFCIVSSDSDYTYLARRISESGCKVWGMGESKKTPDALKNAYNKYIPIQGSTSKQAKEDKHTAKATENTKAENNQQKQKTANQDEKTTNNNLRKENIQKYIRKFVEKCVSEGKPASLSFIGKELKKKYGDSIVKSYKKGNGTSYKSLKEFINDCSYLKVDKNNNDVSIA
ncbi:MAG: NYN domain-containing protein [Atopobium sp.]|uniref:NYN domain-containing protein n=1 Tax=Atopobium sp. TaxID=1872650 RepID=UPI002A756CCF|nr:NYN domain-containing protein [Atopobium sp.]MDY2787858.1 NYN domain-containing protein [Atopobium sp.]